MCLFHCGLIGRKTFGIVAYVCVIVHFLFGLVFTALTAFSRASENGKFSCSVDPKSTVTYKKQVDQACLLRYDHAYNSPLPLYSFVLLSIGLPVLVSVISSKIVSTRVQEIESSHERQTDGEAEHHGQNRRTVYVFYCYFVHLVLRVLFGIIFTVLQHKYFYPNGFDVKFSCNLSPTESRNLSSTSVNCENSTASEKRLSGIIVSAINSIVAVLIFVEVIYLSPRVITGVGLNYDSKFVTVYFLRRRYASLPTLELYDFPEAELLRREFSLDSLLESLEVYTLPSFECTNFYKRQVLNRSYGPKTSFDDLHIGLVIHIERAQHEYSEEMKRHEIYDVHMEVPSTSTNLEKIEDLFYPNEDTKGNFPRRILAIGMPGIGKSVLTEKILHDWAIGIDEYYCFKIAFFFKLRWFNDKLENISLKTFLQFGTGLSEEMFEIIYKEIAKKPQKAILIFDGLDELHGDPKSCLDQCRIIPNNPNICMSANNLFMKLVLGDMLEGATVLVTSRLTADDFYSRLDFDRNVEITGFTSNKIEEYVSRFCENNSRINLKPKLWNHIKSSSELLNLCYIPFNCLIVCVTLSECLTDPRNDTSALPTTLTELYQAAIDNFAKYYHGYADKNPMTEEALKELQRLAFHGMENGELVFNQELFDEQMKTSGLLNSLSNPIFPNQTQFCFIHLTIQEFLAARHVTETLAPFEIKEFISDHVRSGKWHLVLQFIAGLLGKKIKMFDKEYKDCVFAFAESFDVTHGKIVLNYNEVFVMKCLREVDNEEIVKDVCETTAINNAVDLHGGSHIVSPSEWAAVIFVCKHMKNLAILELNKNANCLQEVVELVRKKCVNQLTLINLNLDFNEEPKDEESPESWKWEESSIIHQEKFVKLLEYGQEHPEEIKDVNGVRVCCSKEFLIGRGSDATRVYIGLGKDGYERAVKRLPRDDCTCLAEQEKKVLNELNTTESNYVVKYRFLDDKSDKDWLFLIMDLCEETLKEFVEHSSLDGWLTIAQNIIQQVLKGLADLHRVPKPILHRDLKPSNILRNVNDKWLLADFGISRILTQDVSTFRSKERGTKHWRAIESCSTNGKSDDDEVRYKKESDIQVAGMVAFYIVTKGEHPFGEEPDRHRNLLDGKPVYLDKLEDPAAKDLISWMLSHDPKDRPSAEEALKHPYLQSEKQQFEMLCKVGNEQEIKIRDVKSDVVRKLNSDPKDWRSLMSADVLKYLSTDPLKGKTFPYKPSWTDCLRLIRNVKEHWHDRPRPRPAVFYSVGDPQKYFLNLFPNLPVVVHGIIRSCDYWKERPDLKEYFS